MRAERRLPVLIGAGEWVQREVDPEAALEPLALMEQAARRAFDDAGSGRRLADRVDALAVVNLLSWHYPDPTGLLAERLGIRPGLRLVSTVGGNSPQMLVNEMARRIEAGSLRAVLLAGAEALRSRTLAQRRGVELAWTRQEEGAGGATLVGDPRPGSSNVEKAYGLILPVPVYPLFENALRARAGRGVEEHAERIARVMSRFTEVASENPHAWFREKRSPEEIRRVTAVNRMIAFPYTKYMNAIMEVDQAAALVLTSSDQARALGIPEERWVHWWGGGDASEDPWFVSERPRLDTSPALGAAARAALAQAGIESSDVDLFDLYSCFPCAVEIACRELGIDPLGERPVTVTGGLPYAGGPGNNYSMHAIARMVERLRGAPGSRGMVTALGWYLTKHAAGVYASAPPEMPARPRATAEAPRAAAVPLALEANGRGRIETYTVLYDREGAPARGIVLGRLGDDRRFLANTPGDRRLLESLVASEAVGRRGRVRCREGRNEFAPD